MAIAIVEELWTRIRAAIDDKITAAESAAERAVAAAQSASTGVQADTVGRLHLTPALRGEIDEKVTTTSVNTLSARVDGRPAFFSGAGAPPTSIPHVRVGDWWLNESDMSLHKITAL